MIQSHLLRPTTHLSVRAFLYQESRGMELLEASMDRAENWYDYYNELWRSSDGFAALGAGGLLIDVWGLAWFRSPTDWVLGHSIFWLYALLELLRGEPQSRVWTWEESDMIAELDETTLTLEEVESTTGFIVYPRRLLDLSAFSEQLLREIKLVVSFEERILEIAGRRHCSQEVENALRRNLAQGFSETIADFENELTKWLEVHDSESR